MSKEKPEERWAALIRECSESGEKIAQFCERRGVSRWGFYEWKRRLRGEAPARGEAEFVPVEVVRDTARAARSARGCAAGVEVVLRSGRRIRLERGFDPAALTAAVVALEGVAC